MRRKGSAAKFEHRRRLSVHGVLEGYAAQEVTDLRRVDPSSVRRWVATVRDRFDGTLIARSDSGRPPNLTIIQEKIVRGWHGVSPSDHGLDTELWTAPQLGRMIEERFHIRLNPRSLRA